jgi:uncharacterized protein (TIGR03083 family)
MEARTTAPHVRAELEAARHEFHALLASLADADWRRPSHNPGWTNREVVAHIFLGFQLLPVLVPLVRLWGRLPAGSSRHFARGLNALTGPFNQLNAIGARVGAHRSTRGDLGRRYDRLHRRLVRAVDAMPEADWQRGMYYPTRWDALFGAYLTVADTFAMPVRHLHFHQHQLAPRTAP